MNDRKAASEGEPALPVGAAGGVLVSVDMQTTLALHCGGVLLDAQGRRSITGNCWPGTAAGPLAQSQSGKLSVEVLAPGPPAVGDLIAQLVALVTRLTLRVVGQSARAQVARVGDLEDDRPVRLGPDLLDGLEADPPGSRILPGTGADCRLLERSAAQLEPDRPRQTSEDQRQAGQAKYWNSEPTSPRRFGHSRPGAALGDSECHRPSEPDRNTQPERVEERVDVPDRQAGAVETYAERHDGGGVEERPQDVAPPESWAACSAGDRRPCHGPSPLLLLVRGLHRLSVDLDHLLGDVLRHVLIAVQHSRKRTSPTGDRTQLRGVGEQLRLRHAGGDDLHPVLGIHAQDTSTAVSYTH